MSTVKNPDGTYTVGFIPEMPKKAEAPKKDEPKPEVKAPEKKTPAKKKK